jgi:hypothetical protein
VSSAGTSTAAAHRPGTRYYAPEVRVSKLGDKLLEKGEEGDALANDVLGDLMRAEVTLVNTGISTYSLTFNNWLVPTSEGRGQKSNDVGNGTPAKVDTEGKVPWPHFKYNDLAVLSFGTRLRIDMRYVPEPTGHVPEPTGQKRSEEQDPLRWTPMVSGPITDIQFSFAGGQGAQLTVSGEDDLSVLKDKLEKWVPTKDRPAELTIVKQALKHANFPLDLAPTRVGYPKFVTEDGQGPQETLAGQSVLDFITKLAERLDFEVFLEFANTNDPKSPLGFHFEPYRGRAEPDKNLRSVFRLDRERNLLDFNPTIKVGDQYSTVVVKGRHRDPLLAREVKGEGIPADISDELHRDKDVDGPLTSGPEVRAVFFPGRVNQYVVPNQPNLDDVRADWAAKTVLRKKARELFSIEATTIGVPLLRPGNHVEIRGMRVPFDGYYYVTKTVHTFGADGYRTKISASRPGMELPKSREKPKGATP